FWLADRVLSRGRISDGVWLGVVVAAQAFSSLYYAVFLLTALVVFAAVMLVGRRPNDVVRLIKPALAAGAGTLGLVAPYAVPYAGTGHTRSEQEMEQWSPTLGNYAAALRENWLYGKAFGFRSSLEGTLFPGIAAVVLAIVGCVPPLDRRRGAYLAVLLV